MLGRAFEQGRAIQKSKKKIEVGRGVGGGTVFRRFRILLIM